METTCHELGSLMGSINNAYECLRSAISQVLAHLEKCFLFTVFAWGKIDCIDIKTLLCQHSLCTPTYHGAQGNGYKPRPLDNSSHFIASQGIKLKFDNGPRYGLLYIIINGLLATHILNSWKCFCCKTKLTGTTHLKTFRGNIEELLNSYRTGFYHMHYMSTLLVCLVGTPPTSSCAYHFSSNK